MPPIQIEDLAEGIRNGDVVSVGRAISLVEDRAPGHQELLRTLYPHTGEAHVVGFTGSPGSGKSTLVNQLSDRFRDSDGKLGIVAVDPSSPYSGGSVLGDRIRFERNSREDVFFRSMSSGGTSGGLARSTNDVLRILDAAGYDPLFVETVGAGQSEVEVVRTADTVLVLVDPSSGDDVQMLKAGILEIGDVFVVNKADMDGASTTVADLREMLHMRDGSTTAATGHHGLGAVADEEGGGTADAGWDPEVVETVATEGTGVEALIDVLDDHYAYLRETGELDRRERTRYAEEIRQLLRTDAADLLEDEIERHGGMDALVDEVQARDADPYTVTDRILTPLADCVERRRE